MTHAPNIECVRRILYSFHVPSVTMYVDQEDREVYLLLDEDAPRAEEIATELKDWCGFHFNLIAPGDTAHPKHALTREQGRPIQSASV